MQPRLLKCESGHIVRAFESPDKCFHYVVSDLVRLLSKEGRHHDILRHMRTCCGTVKGTLLQSIKGRGSSMRVIEHYWLHTIEKEIFPDLPDWLFAKLKAEVESIHAQLKKASLHAFDGDTWSTYWQNKEEIDDARVNAAAPKKSPDAQVADPAPFGKYQQAKLRSLLQKIADCGLPDDGRVDVTFSTGAQGVQIPEYLKSTNSICVVLQYRYFDLVVEDDRFEVFLTFNNKWERVIVPFHAVTAANTNVASWIDEDEVDRVFELAVEAQAEGDRHWRASRTSYDRAKGLMAALPESMRQLVPQRAKELNAERRKTS